MASISKVYFAGELFDLKHLIGNAILADAIHRLSEGRYRCLLPQNIEQRDTSPAAIRNNDLFGVVAADCCLFHFDGTDADSGTVVEFMAAKFLDIPSVIVRSDFRAAGDTEEVPFNLMMSSYPRTETVFIQSLFEYQRELQTLLKASDNTPDEMEQATQSISAGRALSDILATKLVSALDSASAAAPVFDRAQFAEALKIFGKSCGSGFDSLLTESAVEEIVGRR